MGCCGKGKEKFGGGQRKGWGRGCDVCSNGPVRFYRCLDDPVLYLAITLHYGWPNCHNKYVETSGGISTLCKTFARLSCKWYIVFLDVKQVDLCTVKMLQKSNESQDGEQMAMKHHTRSRLAIHYSNACPLVPVSAGLSPAATSSIASLMIRHPFAISSLVMFSGGMNLSVS